MPPYCFRDYSYSSLVVSALLFFHRSRLFFRTSNVKFRDFSPSNSALASGGSKFPKGRANHLSFKNFNDLPLCQTVPSLPPPLVQIFLTNPRSTIPISQYCTRFYRHCTSHQAIFNLQFLGDIRSAFPSGKLTNQLHIEIFDCRLQWNRDKKY